MNDSQILLSIIDELMALRAEMLREEGALEDRLRDVCEEHRESARNLAHYIALRRHDIRDLQEGLTAQGLSSLGRPEADVLGAVDALLRMLHRLADNQEQGPDAEDAAEGARRRGVRAECVMLNKGPYIVNAVRALDDILRRMEGHQRKSRSTLRKLRLAELVPALRSCGHG
jgi:hypothetical protein